MHVSQCYSFVIEESAWWLPIAWRLFGARTSATVVMTSAAWCIQPNAFNKTFVFDLSHYSAVMAWHRRHIWRLKSPYTRLFGQQLVQNQNKETSNLCDLSIMIAISKYYGISGWWFLIIIQCTLQKKYKAHYLWPSSCAATEAVLNSPLSSTMETRPYLHTSDT